MNNSLNFNQIWQRITTSRRTRECEAAAHRENALRDEFARRMHALEAQIAQAHAENCRLRAENRALLNSVLGIAGIPPVIVADPPAPSCIPASAGTPDFSSVGAWHAMPGADAWHDAAHPSRTSAASGFVGAQHAVPGADACLDVIHPATSRPSHGRHPEERSDAALSSRSPLRDERSLFVSPGCLDAKPQRDPSLPLVAHDDGAMRVGASENGAAEENVSPNGATSPGTNLGPQGPASPSTSAGHIGAMPLRSQTHLASTPPGTNAVPVQKQMRRGQAARRAEAANNPHVIAPIRRRSWHQIYRMLEFESSRRKEREP